MNDVMKNRLIGLGILIIIGVLTPLLLSRCMHSTQDDNGRGSMRVYNVQPDGKAEPAGNADQPAGSSSGQTSGQQVLADNGGSDQGNAQKSTPDAVSPQSQTDFSTPPVHGNSSSPGQAESASQPAKNARGSESAGMPSNDQRTASSQNDNKNGNSNSAGSSNAHGTASAGGEGSSNGQSGANLEKNNLRGWVVQVASFGNRSNAVSLVHDLKSQFKTSFSPGQVNGKTWYRVNVGPFKDEDAARAAARRLKQQGHGTLVRNLE